MRFAFTVLNRQQALVGFAGHDSKRPIPRPTTAARSGGANMHAASVYSSYDRGVIRGGLSFALLPRLGENRREAHYCSLWNAGYDCPRSKFALVFAVFGNGRLPALHLRHLSTVSCRSPSQERILHSKLHIPAIIASHSAALG